MNCPQCGMASPHITLGTGDDAVTMVSCAGCAKRWWHRNGELIDLRAAIADVRPRRTTAPRQIEEIAVVASAARAAAPSQPSWA